MFCLTSATLCVELKRAVSPAKTQCWWVLFRSSGKQREGEAEEPCKKKNIHSYNRAGKKE